jgi:hypothetical protein
MDEQYIRENDIIGRYLLRQLSDQEHYEFEGVLLRAP